MNHGYTVLFNYTYSHCLQDTETIGNKLQGNTQTNPNNMRFDYGPCDYDLRQNMNAIVCLPGLQIPEPNAESDRRGMVAVVPRFVQRRLPVYAADRHRCFSDWHRPRSPELGCRRQSLCQEHNSGVMQWITETAFTANSAGTFGTTGHELAATNLTTSIRM